MFTNRYSQFPLQCLGWRGAAAQQILCAAFLSVAVLAVSQAASVGFEGDDEQFLQAAPRAWQRYRELAARLQGESATRVTRDGNLIIHTEQTIKQSERGKLLIEQNRELKDSPKLAGRGEVFAYNHRYEFSLRRNAAAAAWFITGTNVDGDAGASQPAKRADDLTYLSGALLFLTNGKWLEELLKEPNFRVTEAKQIDDAGTPAVLIKFQNIHSLDEKAFFPIQSGSLILDPAHFWCLRSTELECLYASGPSTSRRSNEYRLAADGFPIPVRSVEHLNIRGNADEPAQQVEVVLEFNFEIPAALPPDHEFTLTAFGLPEPADAATTSTLYLWLAGAGIVCLVAGIWVRSRYRKSGA